MNNKITYVAQKNKTMPHRMSLNIRILCIVGISIFVFKTYWQRVFNLMDLNISPTSKQFLQAKTENAEKKNYTINDTI